MADYFDISVRGSILGGASIIYATAPSIYLQHPFGYLIGVAVLGLTTSASIISGLRIIKSGRLEESLKLHKA